MFSNTSGTEDAASRIGAGTKQPEKGKKEAKKKGRKSGRKKKKLSAEKTKQAKIKNRR